ncbi:hypothetical protein BZU93_27480, partial [Salmonella enterica subsp. enterica]|nr:hypothetical protein [Salmonella enterica subsp. enterica serovar Enteritidis]
SLAVTLQAEPGAKPAAVDGSVFLGVCETICVPLKAPVSLAVDAAATPAAEADIVARAWAALPASATAQFGVVASSAADDPVTGDTLTLDIKSPARLKDIFVAGDSGYVFGDDYLVFADTGARAMIQIVRRPKEKPDGPGLTYTLITENGAVSGLIPYP